VGGRRAAWAAIVVVAVLARFAFASLVVGLDAPPKGDETDYHAIAQNLLDGDGFAVAEGIPTARRPPAYPAFLAGVYAVTGTSTSAARVAQVLLGAVIVALTGRIAQRYFSGNTARLAAALAAVNPFLIFISGYLLTENLYLLALLGALFVAGGPRHMTVSARRAAACGALLGVATLARPSGLPMFEWVVAALLLLSGVAWRVRIVRAAVAIFAFALVVAPWYARNASVMGGWVLTTHGGVTFLQGNNEKIANTPQWRGGASPLEVLPRHDELSKLDEVSRDRLAWQLGRDYLRNHPGDIPGLVAGKMIRFWRFKSDMGLSGIRSGWWFSKDSTAGRLAAEFDVGLLYAAIALPLFVVGLAVTWRRWRDLSLVYGVIVVHTALAAVFYGSLRSRIPVEPVMCVFAAAAAVALARRFTRRATESA
jgi:4-amino-4-deoxy-L-arabinose transferase-like glycosyltransferase